MLYISDCLKQWLNNCFNIDFDDAKIIAIAKGKNYDENFPEEDDNQECMHILYYINDKFLRLVVYNDNKRLYADIMEKTDKKRKDYSAEGDRYTYYGQDYEGQFEGYLEYEENVLYLMAYIDDNGYIEITPYGKEGYEIDYHNGNTILRNGKDNPLFNFSDAFVLYKLGGIKACEALIEEKFDYEIKF